MPKIEQQKLKNIDTKVGGKFYIFMLNHLETHHLWCRGNYKKTKHVAFWMKNKLNTISKWKSRIHKGFLKAIKISMIIKLCEISMIVKLCDFYAFLVFSGFQLKSNKSSVFVGYVWAIFLNFVGLFSRDEIFLWTFFKGWKFCNISSRVVGRKIGALFFLFFFFLTFISRVF